MVEPTSRPAAPFKEGQVEADGHRIRYLEAGRGHAVVILDGMTWGLLHLHAALAQTYRVIALELPGFGRSPANTTSQSVQDLANTAAQAMAQLLPDPYTLIGTSFAANVALWQTLQVPDQIEALILISPTSIQPVDSPWTGTPETLSRQLLAHPEHPAALPAVDPAIFVKEQALVQRLQGATHDTAAERKLGEIPCATLVVFGSKDRMVAPEAASVYREKIPNCNMVIVYDAGHVILAERPEALISVVADYVERRETFIVGRQNRMVNP